MSDDRNFGFCWMAGEEEEETRGMWRYFSIIVVIIISSINQVVIIRLEIDAAAEGSLWQRRNFSVGCEIKLNIDCSTLSETGKKFLLISWWALRNFTSSSSSMVHGDENIRREWFRHYWFIDSLQRKKTMMIFGCFSIIVTAADWELRCRCFKLIISGSLKTFFFFRASENIFFRRWFVSRLSWASENNQVGGKIAEFNDCMLTIIQWKRKCFPWWLINLLSQRKLPLQTCARENESYLRWIIIQHWRGK